MSLHWHECHWFCRHSFSSPVSNSSSLFLFGGSPSPLSSRLLCEPARFGESFHFLAENRWPYFIVNPIPNLDTAVKPVGISRVLSQDFNLTLIISCFKWSDHVKGLLDACETGFLGLGIFFICIFLQWQPCWLRSDTVPQQFKTNLNNSRILNISACFPFCWWIKSRSPLNLGCVFLLAVLPFTQMLPFAWCFITVMKWSHTLDLFGMLPILAVL